MEKKTVLITGGSGLLGTALSELLVKKGYEVRHISRQRNPNSTYKNFLWNLHEGAVDPKAFSGVDFIVHLAGENISEKRWSVKRKHVLVDSRVKTAQLLKEKMLEQGVRINAFISASGIGYYKANSCVDYLSEDAPADENFLGNCCTQWEAAADSFTPLAERVIKLRTPMVLAKNDGGLKKLTPLVNLGLGAAFGSGKQIVSWVHIDDLCNAFLASIENVTMKGVYNVVAAEQVSNKSFIASIAQVLGRPFFLPNVPRFILQLFLGEMSSLLLEGCTVSSEKLTATGFAFKYKTLDEALKNLLSKKMN